MIPLKTGCSLELLDFGVMLNSARAFRSSDSKSASGTCLEFDGTSWQYLTQARAGLFFFIYIYDRALHAFEGIGMHGKVCCYGTVRSTHEVMKH